MTALVISCDTCTHQDSAHCADCLVTHLWEHPPRQEVVFDLEEVRAVRLLAAAGLVPALEHQAG